MNKNEMQSDPSHLKDIIRYYLDTGLDYGEWSHEYNMHFGFFKWGMNPFRREPMLDQMNQVVFDHLCLDERDQLVYDLGCGLGAPCRSFARRFPLNKITGVTIVPWQVQFATQLNEQAGLASRVQLVEGDYTSLPFADDSADGVFALESACHAEGLSKPAFVREMLRVLKPGQQFVIVDGFVKKDPARFRFLLKYCYEEVIRGWALPSFAHIEKFREEIEKHGGYDIEVKDYSFRIAPSAFHAPCTVLFFLIRKILKGEKLNPVRMGHLKACILGLILGMFRGSFGYYLITGKAS